jgi:hypothetical protein
LRDKVEHRYERVVGAVVAGKCQSLIMNYEAALLENFGEKEGLADVLRFPVFLSTLTEAAVSALSRLTLGCRSGSPADVAMRLVASTSC